MFDYMFLGLCLGLFGGGFFLGTYFGAILMALMAVAKRFDTAEVDLERLESVLKIVG